MVSRKREIKKRCDSYKTHLKDASIFLMNNSMIRRYAPYISISCGIIYKGLSNKNTAWNVNLTPAWEIPVDPIGGKTICGCPGEVKLVIMGAVNLRDDLEIEQSISVSILFTPDKDHDEENGYSCGPLSADQSVIIRHFHFDYDTTLKDNDRPRSHLQYGGHDPSKYLKGAHQYRLFKSLELPRIPLPPLDPVLTLDLFLSQFNTPISNILEDKTWVNLVKTSEKLWLKGYYKELNEHLDSNDKNKGKLYQRQCEKVDWYKRAAEAGNV